jgi:hypothetical protein
MPLSSGQETALIERVRARLPAGFRVQIAYAADIPRNPSGKFEDFVSEVSATAVAR